jgi:uncharacterized coiled-coil protein SlyX
LSRAEEITSEVRRLVLTCRAMEAQLQQSIPKKTHQEVVAKMQASIDGLNGEAERLRSELQKTTTLNESITSLGGKVTSQGETISSLGQTIASLNQVIEVQKNTLAELSAKLAVSTIPTTLYDQTVSNLDETRAKISGMVERSEYDSLQAKLNELTETTKSMVPRSEYLSLQSQFVNFVPKETFETLQRMLTQYVPREQLVASEARLHELEARMVNYVPRSDYEELTARIGSLTREASSLTVEVVPSVVDKAEIPETRFPTELVQSQEITEIQAELREIKGAKDTGTASFEMKSVDATQGFVFANTTFCATNGLEFLQDLEQAPIESIQNHMKGGDFERWFKDVLADQSSADALRSIRESNYDGSELRAKIAAVIAPRYKVSAQ